MYDYDEPTGLHVSSLRDFFFHFWYKDSLSSGSDKVELSLTENESLGKSSGHTEICKLGREGMTCDVALR